jgi:hypothetical protein
VRMLVRMVLKQGSIMQLSSIGHSPKKGEIWSKIFDVSNS